MPPVSILPLLPLLVLLPLLLLLDAARALNLELPPHRLRLLPAHVHARPAAHLFSHVASADVLRGPAGFALNLSDLPTTVSSLPPFRVEINGIVHPAPPGMTATLRSDGVHTVAYGGSRGALLAVWGPDLLLLPVAPSTHPSIFFNVVPTGETAGGNVGVDGSPGAVTAANVVVSRAGAHVSRVVSYGNDADTHTTTTTATTTSVTSTTSTTIAAAGGSQKAACERGVPHYVRVAVAFDSLLCARFDDDWTSVVAMLQNAVTFAAESFSSQTCARLVLTHVEGHCTSSTSSSPSPSTSSPSTSSSSSNSSDPYTSFGDFSGVHSTKARSDIILERFARLWRAHRKHVSRSVAVYFSGFRAGDDAAIGRAFQPGTCKQYGYAWVELADAYTLTHELGHSLGISHAPYGIMRAPTERTRWTFDPTSVAMLSRYLDNGPFAQAAESGQQEQNRELDREPGQKGHAGEQRHGQGHGKGGAGGGRRRISVSVQKQTCVTTSIPKCDDSCPSACTIVTDPAAANGTGTSASMCMSPDWPPSSSSPSASKQHDTERNFVPCTPVRGHFLCRGEQTHSSGMFAYAVATPCPSGYDYLRVDDEGVDYSDSAVFCCAVPFDAVSVRGVSALTSYVFDSVTKHGETFYNVIAAYQPFRNATLMRTTRVACPREPGRNGGNGRGEGGGMNGGAMSTASPTPSSSRSSASGNADLGSQSGGAVVTATPSAAMVTPISMLSPPPQQTTSPSATATATASATVLWVAPSASVSPLAMALVTTSTPTPSSAAKKPSPSGTAKSSPIASDGSSTSATSTTTTTTTAVTTASTNTTATTTTTIITKQTHPSRSPRVSPATATATAATMTSTVRASPKAQPLTCGDTLTKWWHLSCRTRARMRAYVGPRTGRMRVTLRLRFGMLMYIVKAERGRRVEAVGIVVEAGTAAIAPPARGLASAERAMRRAPYQQKVHGVSTTPIELLPLWPKGLQQQQQGRGQETCCGKSGVVAYVAVRVCVVGRSVCETRVVRIGVNVRCRKLCSQRQVRAGLVGFAMNRSRRCPVCKKGEM